MKVTILTLLLGALLLVTGILGWKLINERNKLQANISLLNKELMKANLEIGKAETKFGDANKYIDQLETELKKEIKAKNETLTAYGKLVAKLNSSGGNTTEIPLPESSEDTIDKVYDELTPFVFYWVDKDKRLIDLGSVLESTYEDHKVSLYADWFSAGEPERTLFNSLRYNLHLKIEGQLLQTKHENGAINHYLNLWVLDGANRRTEELKLESFQVVVEDNRKLKFWISPHLDIGIVGGYRDGPVFGGSIGVTGMGIGLTENDLVWRFARFGMTIVPENILVEVTPVLYNVGKLLPPLISDLWIGPSVVIHNKIGYVLSLNTVL